jgi:hypothetical protein
MTDPKKQERDPEGPDELGLDPETIRDLEPDASATQDVKGGVLPGGRCSGRDSGCN